MTNITCKVIKQFESFIKIKKYIQVSNYIYYCNTQFVHFMDEAFQKITIANICCDKENTMHV